MTSRQFDYEIEYDSDTETLTVGHSPSNPDAGRNSCMRSYVENVRRLFTVESMTVIMDYQADSEE